MSPSSAAGGGTSSVVIVAGFMCGNGHIDSGEDCDAGTGNTPPGTLNGRCACDPKDPSCVPDLPGIEWTKGCRWHRCGDGKVNNSVLFHGNQVNDDLVHEQCDDGNRVNGDGCAPNCTIENTSGGSFSSGNSSSSANSSSNSQYLVYLTSSAPSGPSHFTFTNPNPNNNTNTNSETHTACQASVCVTLNGPGPSECYGTLGCGTATHMECNGNACMTVLGPGGNQCGTSADCAEHSSIVAVTNNKTLVAAAGVCGNGILEAPEECDDANRRSSDGCSESCLLEIGICGDGKVESLLGEQCEASTFDRSLPYDCMNCRFVSRSCGDGKVDAGEECDNGTMNSTSPNAACRPDCSLSRCGDGIRDTGEECDPPTLLRSFGEASDGNRKNGDGCDMHCEREAGSSQSSAINSSSSVRSEPLVAATYFPNTTNIPNPYGQNINFPQYPNFQPYVQQLPYAQLQPLLSQAPHTTQSGPAAVAAIGAGAAAGMSWVRRKRRGK